MPDSLLHRIGYKAGYKIGQLMYRVVEWQTGKLLDIAFGKEQKFDYVSRTAPKTSAPTVNVEPISDQEMTNILDGIEWEHRIRR